MYQPIIQKTRENFEKTFSFLKDELKKMRSGRATPALVEDLNVEVFRSKMPLKSLASISCPEPRQILIQPWSEEYLEPITKLLEKADLGAMPLQEGKNIRITLPALNEEFRKNLIKKVSQKAEEIRQVLRRHRDEAWKEIQEKFREGQISEDDKFRAKDELQDLIEEYNKKVEELVKTKEEEIMG